MGKERKVPKTDKLCTEGKNGNALKVQVPEKAKGKPERADQEVNS